MPDCPYCGKPVKVSNAAAFNVEGYGKSVRARSECCGKILFMSRTVTFRFAKTNQDGKDDWGK